METKVVNLIIKTGDANKSIKKTDKSIKGFKKNTVDAGKSATKSIKGVDSAFNALPSSIQGAVGQVKNLGTSFKALAIGGAVGAIAGLGSLFVMATKKGAAFAKQMSTLKAVSGATTSEIDALASSAKNLGSTTQFTAIEVGELQTEFAKMGFSTKQILASTKATLDLAASMEVGLAEAATLAGSTVNAFGLEAKDTQRVVDVLAASTSESALDFSSLTEAFKNVAPAAKATNRSVEETSALLGVLANNGIKGSRAGTQLSKAFVELNKKGLPLNEALDKIRNSSNGLKTAMELAGERGGKALLVLSDKRPQIEALTRSFENSAGAANKMAEVRLDNLAGDTTKLSSAWEGLLLSIEDGEGLFSGIARGIVQATTSIIGFLTPSQDLANTYFQQVDAVNNLESSMTPLLNRYDELTTKTDLSNIEQEELDGLILKIAQDIPQAVTQFDEYGKAMGISTEAAKKFLKEQKDILKIQNREAIKEQQDAIENLNDKLKIYGNALEKRNGQFVREVRTYTKLGGEIISYVKLTDKEITARSNRRREIGEEIKARTAMIAKLKGEKTAAEKAVDAANKGKTVSEEQTVVIRDLIKEQQDLLEQAEKLPQSTEAELAVKNKKISLINLEIKRLKTLGVEQKKKGLKDVKEIEVTNELNQKLLEQIDIKEDLFDLEEEEEEPEFETDFLAKTEKASKLQTEVKIGAIVNEIEREKQLKLQNLLWNKENIIEQSILDGTYSAEQRLAIETDYLQKKEAIELASAERERRQKLQTANVNLQIAANGLNMVQSLGDAAFAHRMKNLKEGSREQLKAAKQQFNFNKALQLGMAVIDGGKAITASLAQAPIAIGPIPNPAGIASLAFASITSAAQIAMIAAKKYEPNKTSASVSSSPTPSGGGGTAPSQPPSFNVVGTSGINQVSQALNGQQPVQAFVVAGAVTTAQQLQNNTIQTATF